MTVFSAISAIVVLTAVLFSGQECFAFRSPSIFSSTICIEKGKNIHVRSISAFLYEEHQVIGANLERVREHLQLLQDELMIRRRRQNQPDLHSLMTVSDMQDVHREDDIDEIGKLEEEVTEAVTVVNGFEALLRIDKDLKMLERQMRSSNDANLREKAERFHFSFKESRENIATELNNFMEQFNQASHKDE